MERTLLKPKPQPFEASRPVDSNWTLSISAKGMRFVPPKGKY
jgi:hypothetical protein